MKKWMNDTIDQCDPRGQRNARYSNFDMEFYIRNLNKG